MILTLHNELDLDLDQIGCVQRTPNGPVEFHS